MAPQRPLLVPGLLRNNFDLIPKNVVEGRMCPRDSFSLERAEDDRLDQLMSLTVFRKHHRYRISIPLPHNCGTYRWLVVQSVPLSSCALPLESAMVGRVSKIDGSLAVSNGQLVATVLQYPRKGTPPTLLGVLSGQGGV